MNCFNSDRFLREAIASVMAQSYANWEIVFWDNQSTDSSAEIVKSFDDPRIRYFHAEHHTPLGEARHLAMQETRGEWVGLLDCDDIWLPEKLSAQMKLVGQNPHLGLIYSDMWLIDSSGDVTGKGSDRFRMQRGKVWQALLSSRNFIPCPAAIMKRQAVFEVSGFDLNLRYCEEFDLFLKIAKRYEVDFVREPLVKYRIHSGNITGFGNRQTTKEYISVLRRELTMSRQEVNSSERSLRAQLQTRLRLSLLQARLAQQTLLENLRK